MSARPYVICHMCTTLDGKILSSRWGTLRGNRKPAELFETDEVSIVVAPVIDDLDALQNHLNESKKVQVSAPQFAGVA